MCLMLNILTSIFVHPVLLGALLVEILQLLLQQRLTDAQLFDICSPSSALSSFSRDFAIATAITSDGCSAVHVATRPWLCQFMSAN